MPADGRSVTVVDTGDGRVAHLVRQGRGARGLRWAVVVFGLYNSIVHAVEGRWLLAAAWTAVTLALLAVQLAPRRLGTAVEHGGLRVGSGSRWGRLVSWDEVERLRLPGPYDRWGSLLLRDGHRVLLLRGMTPAAVRELAAARALPLDDPAQRRSPATDAAEDDERGPRPGPGGRAAGAPLTGAADLPDDGPLDGPFHASRRAG